jgi:ABC-type Co2+ transport system permease subunit
MDWVGIIIQLILGAVGGYGTGRVAKQVSINPTVDGIVGLIGGYLGTWIAGLIPGLAGMLAGGGAAYVGQGATGLIGGAILTAIVGGIKNAVAK